MPDGSMTGSGLLEMVKGMRCAAGDDAEAGRVLCGLYHGKDAGVQDAGFFKSARDTLKYLVRMKYLQKENHTRGYPVYSLTLRGRCKVLCQKLGITFLGLCVLAEAYMVQKYQAENGCRQSYPIYCMDVFVEEIWSSKTIRNAAVLLCSTGIAERCEKKTIRIPPDIVAKLESHEATLAKLHKWIAGIPRMLDATVMQSTR